MMEFIDLKAQQARLEARLRERLEAVLAHGRFIMGPEVRELEERLSDFVNSRHCISCSSGSDALLMALMAWNVGPGDAVFVPAFTFFATAEMAALLGATPVFVDIDPRTFNMDPQALGRAIAAVRTQDASLYPLPQAALERPLRPRCVIPVDLFGQAADYENLLPLAAREGVTVLEDGAQAFGAVSQGKKVCGLGCPISTTSFFPAKPLGCYGDGGAVFTDDDALAAELASIRIHGKGEHKYDNRRIGINGRMDTFQASVLLAKLEIFEDELARRCRAAVWYAERLSSISGVTPPFVSPGATSVFAQYTVRISDGRRDAVAAGLHAREIPTNIYYPKPLHIQGAFSHLGYQAEDMPIAARCSTEVLSLPFHPYLEERVVDEVCTALKACL